MITVMNNNHVVIPYKKMVFSGGEVHVKFQDVVDEDVVLLADIHSSDDLMELMFLVDAIRRNAVDMEEKIKISLVMPYVPYARQDRLCNEGESFSLKVFCDIINSMNFEVVAIADPHSDVTPALLNNVIIRTQEQCFIDTMGGYKFKMNVALVSPDAGANKKTYKVAKAFNIDTVIRADKIRDVTNGEILETVVYCEHLGNRDVLIVDDICDGGRTFIELAKVLRTKTDGKIMLYVTHGIFSKGFDVFDGIIDEIYCFKYFGSEKPANKNVFINLWKGEF